MWAKARKMSCSWITPTSRWPSTTGKRGMSRLNMSLAAVSTRSSGRTVTGSGTMNSFTGRGSAAWRPSRMQAS
ncbi:MAG: hypothetical protein A6D92_02460 [Symbiobacterium thermophilum]|uniref:Uncharacterized protein n=1 Tax=Symbiobacterium thermophilum TaxID=2734 RepID=A0A1Y2T9P3_SYMTR|nr:MAG: hypothetical protein A6D92_02460 [Symbiobacterium thermophilum]